MLNHLFKENFSRRQGASVGSNDLSLVSSEFSTWLLNRFANVQVTDPEMPQF